MKCKIPEISWHNRDPVLSVDIQPKIERSTNEVRRFRLASGGSDSHVLIWYLDLNTATGDVELELAADLSRHQRAVNAVRWSPNGELLASGDDESVIFIWKQKSETETLNLLDSTNAEDKEIWLTLKVLRGHMEDVYDLSWAPNSQLLVSGSVDNTAMVWDVHKGKSLAILGDHKGFVQGVAWDPYNKYIATLSTDRYLRIFDIQTKKVVYRINKSLLPVPADHDLYEKNCRLFHDDTLQTFFRRLNFTPDGKLLITPSGLTEYADFTHPLETSYIFSRFDFKQPAIVLPSPEQYTVAVRCCPLLFKLRPHSEQFTPVVPLPYRMIFAVATRCSVYFYDTQQIQPFAVISNIHYMRLTDITWSVDGRIVVVSSADGFCSLISFNEGELGEEYEETAADLLAQEQVLQQQNQATKKKQIIKNKLMDEQKSPEQKLPTVSEEEKENNVEFVIDKEIISSVDKFETPAKKTVDAKPIEIRRHPRAPKELVKVLNEEENLISDDDDIESVEKETRPKLAEDEEIISDEDEIRSEVEEQRQKEEENELMEVDECEAEDSTEKNADQQKEVIEEETNKLLEEEKSLALSEEESEKKLKELDENNAQDEVVEESNKTLEIKNKIMDGNTAVDEETKNHQGEQNKVLPEKSDVGSPIARLNYLSPSERTPRRVALRTISTPKSKKKLLE